MERQASAKQSPWRRIVLPLLYALLLVLACALVAGSYLIEIEDHYANMVFGGGYGAYDPYVPAINPHLGRLVTALYSLVPAVNWFGVLLLVSVGLAGAASMGLAARRPGGLVPGIVILSPILMVLACTPQSQVVSALCLISGLLSVLDGCQEAGMGKRRMLAGVVLCVLGVMLSMEMVWPLALCVLACFLAHGWRKARRAGLITGVIIALVALGVPMLLAMADSTWRVYHNQYMAYDYALQSTLRLETETLLDAYGVTLDLENGAEEEAHDHADDAASQEETALAQSSFGKALGWSLNDADLFTRRVGADARLVDPAAVSTLGKAVGHFTLDGLWDALWATLQKMQFLMLLALFLLCALVLQVTNRRKGALALLAAAITFGGHVLMVAFGRDAFCDIAPFYILGILVLLHAYDAKASLEWFRRVVPFKVLRGICAALVAIGFVGALGTLGYMMRRYNQAESPSVAAATDLYAMMELLPDAVFIGDNPLDRYNPSALAVPTVGSDARLLAGSYDLYSPRYRAIQAQYGLENPLLDAVDRADVFYVDISGSNLYLAAHRLYEAYGVLVQADVPYVDGEPMINESSQHRMQLYRLVSTPQAEGEAALEDNDEAAENTPLATAAP